MRECIICGSQMSDDATTCGTCGFSSRRRFLSRTHYQSWMEQTVIPYRKKWERRTEELFSKAEPALTEKSTEPDSQVKNENQAVKKPKKMIRGIIAVIVVLAVFALGVIAGARFFSEASEPEAVVEENDLSFQIVELITEVPQPSEIDETLNWLSEHEFYYKYEKDSTNRYHVQIGSIDAYYTSRFWRLIWYNSDEYESIKLRLEELKYHISYTDETDTQLITTYTKEGKPSIRLIYDTSNHNLRIILNQT